MQQLDLDGAQFRAGLDVSACSFYRRICGFIGTCVGTGACLDIGSSIGIRARS